MDAGEVLLVDLSRAGGDNAWLFGGLVIARYYVDALGRQAMPPAARVPHTLYVDEVQNFDTSAIRGTLAEGRKFALQAGLATQYFDSLGRELQRGIRANVATTMLLQPSADDARLLRDEMAPLTERDLRQPAALPDGRPDRARWPGPGPHRRRPAGAAEPRARPASSGVSATRAMPRRQFT